MYHVNQKVIKLLLLTGCIISVPLIWAGEPKIIVTSSSQQGIDTNITQQAMNIKYRVDSTQLQSVSLEKADWKTFNHRLVPFLSHTDWKIRYQANKARMWLIYAGNESSEHSLSSAEKESIIEAQKIIEGLEQGKRLDLTTKILSASKVMRRDLWLTAELLKHHQDFPLVSDEVAQAEVMLVWAAAEHCELGWRHSRELFAAAERLIDEAIYQAPKALVSFAPIREAWNLPSMKMLNGEDSGCHGVKGKWPIWSPSTVSSLSENSFLEETISVPNNIHFALDQSYLTTQSKSVLNQIIKILKDKPETKVTLYGHTDRRASDAYNFFLSKRRVLSVASYLEQQGIANNRIALVAKGKQLLAKHENNKQSHALNRRVEVIFHAEDGAEISVFSQFDDVQLEY